MLDYKVRCSWVDVNDELSCSYHDYEWGIPVYDDDKLFEALVLELSQAGLSWNTILQKRENYRKAFANFSIEKVASFDDSKIESLLNNKGIVRHRLKIEAAVKNAKVILAIKKEFGSFSKYIWSFTNGKTIVMAKNNDSILSKNALSDKISKELKKRGMKFIGSTTIYSFLQAVGIINDHSQECFLSPNK